MTVQEFRDLVGRISYKSDWILDTHPAAAWMDTTQGRGLDMVLTMRVPNVLNPSEIISVRQACSISREMIEDLDETRALAWVHDFLMSGERHESEEWFRYKGVQVFPPHKGERT